MADDNVETSAPIATETPSEATKPEYVQDKFWNNDTKQVNIENLASSYNSLEQKLGSRTEDLSKQIREDMSKERASKVPESYKLNIPEQPQNVDLKINPLGDINNTPGLQERAKEIILAGQDTVHGKIPDVDNYDIDLMLAIPRGEMAVIHKDEYSLASQYRILFRESENGELREIAQEGAFDIDWINTHFVILNKTDMDISHMGDI